MVATAPVDRPAAIIAGTWLTRTMSMAAPPIIEAAIQRRNAGARQAAASTSRARRWLGVARRASVARRGLARAAAVKMTRVRAAWTRRAPGQPRLWTSQAVSGRKMGLAKAPRMVSQTTARSRWLPAARIAEGWVMWVEAERGDDSAAQRVGDGEREQSRRHRRDDQPGRGGRPAGAVVDRVDEDAVGVVGHPVGDVGDQPEDRDTHPDRPLGPCLTGAWAGSPRLRL
jgi:hypothetical protein